MSKKIKQICWGIVLLLTPILVVNSVNFYMANEVVYHRNTDGILWGVTIVLIFISMYFSCYLIHRQIKLENKMQRLLNSNALLSQQITLLSQQIEDNHCENIEYQQNTREILMGD